MVRRIVLLFFVALLAFPLFAQGYNGEDYGDCYYREVIDTSYKSEDEGKIAEILYSHFKGEHYSFSDSAVSDVSLTMSELNKSEDGAIFSFIAKAKLDGFPVSTMVAIGGSEEKECVLVLIFDSSESKEGISKKKYRLLYDSWVDCIMTAIHKKIESIDR